MKGPVNYLPIIPNVLMIGPRIELKTKRIVV